MFAVHLRWLDAKLATRDWFTGDEFTAADVMMSFPLEAAQQRAGLDGRYPRLQAWLARIHERPAYTRRRWRGAGLMLLRERLQGLYVPFLRQVLPV